MTLAVEQSGAIRILRIDRSEVHNALNARLIRELAESVESAAVDPSARVVIITGTGERAFSAGADLDELRHLDAASAIAYMRTGQRYFRQIEQAAIPTIAAVNGLALGGGFELALSCTFAVASDAARFALPEAALGLIPGYGGTQRLQRRIGSSAAAYLMLTGRRLDPERAYQLGLLAVPPVTSAELLPTVLSIAGEIAGKGPAAVAKILQLAHIGADLPLDIALDLESVGAALAIAGPESDEGIAAFSERRAPLFTGKEAS
jgi:enoyl-CoA hydratase